MNNDSYDDIDDMIQNNAGDQAPPSPDEISSAAMSLFYVKEEIKKSDSWIRRYRTLPALNLEVKRDDSDEYFKALKDALIAITSGDYGSIDYKGYQIYYTDTPQVSSISAVGGHVGYSYWITFHCDALRVGHYEEYHSEEERVAYLTPGNELFEKTLVLLDRFLQDLDDGTWIKKKNTLEIYDFKNYSSDATGFKKHNMEDRNKDANSTFMVLFDDAFKRAEGHGFSEKDFETIADVIRRMVFFADYGKRNYLFQLEGFVRYTWKPKSKLNKYIRRCMNKFGQGDQPDRLLDACAMYYYLYNPQAWEAVACILPLIALWEMCRDYDPDNVRDRMLDIFNFIPHDGYRERVAELVEGDRAKSQKGECTYDQNDN